MRWMLLLAAISGCAWTNQATVDAQRREQARRDQQPDPERDRIRAEIAARVQAQEEAKQRQRAAIEQSCQAALATTDPAMDATRASCIQLYASEKANVAADARQDADHRAAMERQRESERAAARAAWAREPLFPTRKSVSCTTVGNTTNCTEN